MKTSADVTGDKMNQSNATTILTQTNGSTPLVVHTDTVILVVTIMLATNIAASLSLNILLIFVMQYSPSLQTPPNSNLVNICINNIFLCVDMVLCAVCLSCNSIQLVDKDTAGLLSGIQLFLTYNGLLQYWGSFVSIGYYRYRTIKKPRLTLRQKRLLVTRCVVMTWIVSVILSFTLSASFVPSSRYALSTLDPFMRDFYNEREENLCYREHVTISLVIGVALIFGLVIILMAYYSIWKTIRGVTFVGKNRVSPRPAPFHLQSDSSDLTLSTGRSYRPQYAISSNCIGSSLSRAHKETFVVAYNCKDNSVTLDSCGTGDGKQSKPPINTEGRIRSLSTYGQRRPLQTSWSTISNCSIKSKSPEFTDISIGADLLRFQREQRYGLNRCSSHRPERVGMGNAIRNSIAMLVVFLTCSLPLIVITCPIRYLETLSAVPRLHIFLLCRLLFFFNAPVYPIWYLVFNITVRKCLARLWEGFMLSWHDLS